MNRTILGAIGIVLVLAIVVGTVGIFGYFFAADWPFLSWFRPDPPSSKSLGPSVTELEKLGELVVTKVHVADVLEANGLGHRGLWLVSGEALISIDMSTAKIGDKDPISKKAIVTLPEPRVISSRVNHEKTKTYDFESTTWLPWKRGDQGILRDHAMLHAQRLVEHAARREEGFSHAKSNAELLVHRMYQQADWDVEVMWEPPTSAPNKMPSE